MTDHHEHGVGLQDNTEVLHRISTRLADRFAGVFAAETVERYVFESYAALARTAKIKTYLPSTTEHFANDRLNALAKSKGAVTSDVPEVLFVCVQNAGRSQMAAALLTVEAKGRIDPRPVRRLPAGRRTGPRRRRGDVRNGPGPDQGLSQAAHRRRRARLRCGDHDGLR